MHLFMLIVLRKQNNYNEKGTLLKVPFYFLPIYKSNTEVRLARIKSFNLIQKAKVKYTPNPSPAVTKEI